MNARTEKWLYGLGAAVIGGGAQSIVSGLTGMGFAPDKFNFTNASGIWHLLGLMAVNFLFSAILSAAFYLRQSPLPPESTGDTQMVRKDGGFIDWELLLVIGVASALLASLCCLIWLKFSMSVL